MNLHQARASQSANKIANLAKQCLGGCFVTTFRFFKRQKHKYNHCDCFFSEWCALLDCMTRETETTIGHEPCEFHVFCYQLETLLVVPCEKRILWREHHKTQLQRPICQRKVSSIHFSLLKDKIKRLSPQRTNGLTILLASRF